MSTIRRIQTAVSVMAMAAAATFSNAQDKVHNTLTAEETVEGFSLLFNGSDLDGWTTSGNMDSWSAQDGEISTGGKGGWWLRTERQYRDFDLRLEFHQAVGFLNEPGEAFSNEAAHDFLLVISAR